MVSEGLIIFVVLLALYIINDRHRRKKKAVDFTQPSPQAQLTQSNPLRDSESMPSDDRLRDHFTEEKFELYKFLKTELQEKFIGEWQK